MKELIYVYFKIIRKALKNKVFVGRVRVERRGLFIIINCWSSWFLHIGILLLQLRHNKIDQIIQGGREKRDWRFVV